MKRLNILFATMLAVLFGSTKAWADVVADYTWEFNNPITTTDHEFKPAPGWGHVSHYYTFGGYYGEKVYPTYTYTADEGRNGSGAIKVNTQTKVTHPDYYGQGTTSDVLVTPAITGKSSIWVKKVTDEGTLKLFNVTYTASTNKYSRSTQISDFTCPELSTTEWTKVDLPEMEGKSLGICASDVIIDDFEAAQVDLVLFRSLKIAKLTMKSSGSPDCDADNKIPFSFDVTLQNVGDVDFAPGDENFSLSLVNYSNSYAEMFTTPLTEAMNVGDEKTFSFEGTYNLSDLLYNSSVTRCRIDVQENISNTRSYGGWIEPVPYKPILVMRSNGSRIDSGVSYNWGKINSAAPRTFTIENGGAAPLNITSITTPTGFSVDNELPMTIAPHQKVDMNLALTATEPGEYSGDVVIKGEGIEDFTISVQCVMLDPNKYYINFEDKQLPPGSYIEDNNWTISETGLSGSGNAYFLKNSRTNADVKFVTPLLEVTEGEKLSLDAARAYYSSNYESSYLNVYYSTDRKNWTLARKIMSEEMSGEKENVNYHYEGKLTPFEIDNIPAGKYYLAFGAGYVCLDNIYGYKLADVVHDWMLVEEKVPANGVVNSKYQASATLRNFNVKDEAAGSYTATLYMNEEAIATAESVELKAGADAKFDFGFTPHQTGSYDTYILFKGATDDYQLSTDTVTVTIGEELASKEIVIGKNDATQSYAPVNWYNIENKLGAQVDMLYKAEMLTEQGLQAGVKITSVSYTGNIASARNYTNLDFKAYVGMVSEEGYTAQEVKESDTNLQKIVVMDKQPLACTVNEDITTTITFNEPIVWDGVSAIRVYTDVCANGNEYNRINYPSDSRYKTACYKSGSNLSFTSSCNLPVATFGIATDPLTISGTVTSKGKAVQGATVSLTNDEILYSGTTDEEGKYSFSVIQTDKKYKFTVTADKFVDFAAEDSVEFTESVVKDVEMQKIAYTVDGTVNYRLAPLAGATVTLQHADEEPLTATTNEEGKYSFAEVEPETYTLTVKAETFNDYTASEPIEITEAKTLEPIYMTKKPVAVTGSVTYRDAALAGATAYLTREGVKLMAISDNEGKFTFSTVTPDYKYALSVEAEKFDAYTATDSIEITAATTLEPIAMVKTNVKVSGKVIYHAQGVAGATVKLSRTDAELTATTNETGDYEFTDVVPDYSYTVTVTADKFVDYATETPVEVTDNLVLDDITLVKQNVKIYGIVVWGDTPMQGINISCTETDGATTTVTTDAEGKYELTEINPEKYYTLVVSDANDEFKPLELGPVKVEEDFEQDFFLKAKPIEVAVGTSGYTTFSAPRAINFAKATGLKAYVVTELNNNVLVLSEVTEVPANTGVLIEAASGTYDVTPVPTATNVEKNLLVAAAEDYLLTDANVGKVWTLDETDGMAVFTSKAGTTVAAGKAYLAVESAKEILYLSEASGINAANAFTSGKLDANKPMYNLAGQRVGKDYKGVIIQNGKKYTVK